MPEDRVPSLPEVARGSRPPKGVRFIAAFRRYSVHRFIPGQACKAWREGVRRFMPGQACRDSVHRFMPGQARKGA